MPRTLLTIALLFCPATLFADAPIASYVFPAGGQRGSKVKVRAGGLCLYDRCEWEILGAGVSTSKHLTRTKTLWFEGPRLPLPDSQRQEDYPQDMLGEVTIAKDAPPGLRRGRVWTSEGAHAGLAFLVGDLPEVIEDEIDGDPVAVNVKLPVTINGRIFPREDIDIWAFDAKQGQQITCEVHAARFGSPLDSRVMVFGPDGKQVAENDDARGTDSVLYFTAPKTGQYTVRIHDSQRSGSQRHVYRLTISDGPYIDHVYPLGARKGVKTRFALIGANVPKDLEASVENSSTHTFSVNGKPTNIVPLDVDDLPEHLESEPNDIQVSAVKVALPCIVNGRIDRAGDVDCWQFEAKKGQSLQLSSRGEALGSPLATVVEVLDAKGKVITSGLPRATEIQFIPPSDGTYTVRLREQFRTRGGPAFAYRLRLREAKSEFRLELPSLAHTAMVGQKANFRINVVRSGGFTGPIALSFKGLPANVKVTPTTINPNQGQVDLAFEVAKDAAIGTSRIQVVGTALIDGKSIESTAKFPDSDTNEILLGVGVKAPFKIIGIYDLRLAARGSVFRKKFKIERNGFSGPLEVRLADKQNRHLQGVSGPTLTIAPDVNEFEYPVTLPPWMETGRTSRACVMAVGKVKIDGVEHTVSFSSQAQNDQIIAVVETGQLALELAKTSLAVKPGDSAELSVNIRRGKELTGEVKVELLAPTASGISAEPITIAADRTNAVMNVKLAAMGRSRPVLVRATLQSKEGPIVAEASVEIVSE